ncbi:mucin-5B-like [Xenopus tropicalis]|uniref:Mucin-5B-like n=1 Tax=Xenopus tropicalis TaxID=8364 RepID=A0A8J1IPN9_XENTR|nr:mucin-5B-like [Xenopus tropicalis]
MINTISQPAGKTSTTTNSTTTTEQLTGTTNSTTTTEQLTGKTSTTTNPITTTEQLTEKTSNITPIITITSTGSTPFVQSTTNELPAIGSTATPMSCEYLSYWVIILIGIACILALGLLFCLFFGLSACVKTGHYKVKCYPSYFPHFGLGKGFGSSYSTDLEGGIRPVQQTG